MIGRNLLGIEPVTSLLWRRTLMGLASYAEEERKNRWNCTKMLFIQTTSFPALTVITAYKEIAFFLKGDNSYEVCITNKSKL